MHPDYSDKSVVQMRAFPTRRLAGAVLAMAAFSTLGACGDGYPTEDVPAVHPAALTPQERIAAMNELAEDADSAQRWRYALANDCTLQVQAIRRGEKRTGIAIPLHGAQAGRDFDDEERDYSVTLIRGTGIARERTTVFRNAERIDSLRMQALVNGLLADCPSATAHTG